MANHALSEETTNLLILGGGPAGYTAALYACRAGWTPILYQGPQPGGQLMITSMVENYPGYPQGVLGPAMMEDFKQQALRFGTEVRIGMATSVHFNKYPLEVTIDQTHNITAKAVIIATGSSAKWLGIPSEEKLNGKGVSACAVCDGFFFKDKEVAIVGGGDSAAEEALYLANTCKKVYMLVRRDVMRASHIMQQRVFAHPKITVLWHTETQEILGENHVEGVRTIHTKTGKIVDIPIEGFFVAIGHQPNTAIFAQGLPLNEQGYIVTESGTSITGIKGVFAAGDVQDGRYRQAITAAGSGCMAALDAVRFLQE